MLNRICLIGRIASDPELKYTPNGNAVCSFRIAVERSRKDAHGVKETDFIPIVTWRQSAEFVANYLGKGRLVGIDGRLQIRSWSTDDGTRRNIAEVVAENVRALDRGKKTEEGGSEPEVEGTTEDTGDAGEVPEDVIAGE